MGIKDDELAGLSDAERLALEEDEDTSVDHDDVDPPGEAPAEQDAPAAAEAPAAEPEPESAPAEEAKVDEPEDDYDEPFVAQYKAEPVEGYADKLADLDGRFENGDVTLKEYNTQREALLKQQLKAEIAQEQNAQAAQQKWQWEIERFMEDNASYTTDPILYAALDAAIKALAAKSENGDKAGRWFLSEAHKQVQARFAAPPAAAPAADKPTAKRGDKAADVPRTLSTLPAADISEAGGSDEFANIEALFNKGKVIEAERLLAKLSPEAQVRYLEAAG